MPGDVLGALKKKIVYVALYSLPIFIIDYIFGKPPTMDWLHLRFYILFELVFLLYGVVIISLPSENISEAYSLVLPTSMLLTSYYMVLQPLRCISVYECSGNFLFGSEYIPIWNDSVVHIVLLQMFFAFSYYLLVNWYKETFLVSSPETLPPLAYILLFFLSLVAGWMECPTYGPISFLLFILTGLEIVIRGPAHRTYFSGQIYEMQELDEVNGQQSLWLVEIIERRRLEAVNEQQRLAEVNWKRKLEIINLVREATADEIETYSDICSVCRDGFQTARVLPCGHMLHDKCFVSNYKGGNRTCPICRQPVRTEVPVIEISVMS